MNPDTALYVVVAFAAGAVLLAWVYFRAYRVVRPPIGVINLRDVALMIGAIVLVPYLYVAVPPWLAAALLGVGMLTILQVTFEPILRRAWLAWVLALLLLGVDVAAALAYGAPSTSFQRQQHRPGARHPWCREPVGPERHESPRCGGAWGGPDGVRLRGDLAPAPYERPRRTVGGPAIRADDHLGVGRPRVARHRTRGERK